MSPKTHFLLRALAKAALFALIVGAGWLVYARLAASRPEPGRKDEKAPVNLVQVIPARAAEGGVELEALGTVVPARQLTLTPEVAGRVVQVHPSLVPGGRVRAGDALVAIDPRDYDLAIRQQQARVKQAELDLARERGLKSVAEREWTLIKDEVQPTEEGRKLALRELQVETAQVALAAAQAGLEQAELARGRTLIRAPWNALVTEESIELGQVVGAGTKLASLVGTDEFWVRASLPVDRLGWLRWPSAPGDEGAPARVLQATPLGGLAERPGRVVRLLGELDPKGRLARVLVAVPSPLEPPPAAGPTIVSPREREGSMAQAAPGAAPLLLGSYVEVRIEGPGLPEALALPRKALRDQDRVWVLGKTGKLEIRAVQVLWARADEVLVRGALQPGELVVTSRLATAVEGLPLQIEGPGAEGGAP